MVDMELAEAYTNIQVSKTSSERVEFGRQVLDAHGVSEETLDTTLAWYGRNMDSYTELFAKVDKEIERRREKYTKTDGETKKESDNLWPYVTHAVISPLSGSDALSFSLPNPEMEKGEILTFSLFLPNNANLKGTFGVEYSDGSGEANVMNYNSKNKVEIVLQTDTSRKVSRIFGSMQLKNKDANPIYLDSIMIKGEPFDSLTYRSKRRNQKTFGAFNRFETLEKNN